MAYFFILLGALLRVIPHPANFAPITGLALFGGAHINRKYALLVPLAAMVVSDFFIGFDGVVSRATVYGSFLLAGMIGMWLKDRVNVYTVVGASLASSVVFFLVTNLPFVHPASLYPYTLAGTMQSYASALPFFRNTLLGDLFYSAALFGAYEAVNRYAEMRAKRSNPNAAEKKLPKVRIALTQ